MNSRQAGFTLIELLVVVAIFAVLSAFAIPYLNDMRGGSENKQIARSILYEFRKARDLAVTQNRAIAVSLDLDSHRLSYDATKIDFPTRISLEADDDLSTLASSGTKTLNFSPQGSVDSRMFVRVDGDAKLTVQLDLNGAAKL